MAYLSTFVCDFLAEGKAARPGARCRTLADAQCALCERHGCAAHVPCALRVALSITAQPGPLPVMPLPGHAAADVPAAAWLDTSVRVSSVDNCLIAERRVCMECAKSAHSVFDVPTTRAPELIDEVVVAVRAALAEKALSK